MAGQTGVVVHQEPGTAFIVVRHNDGFTLVELKGHEGMIDVGEAVTGEWAIDSGAWVMTSTRLKLEACFQGTWGTLSDALAVARTIH
jgi:hypothetical protein